MVNSYINVTNDDQIEQSHKDEVIEAIFFLNKELLQDDLNPDVKDFFYEAVLNLPYDILEKLADPFLNDIITNENIKTGLAIRRNLGSIKKEYSLSAMNAIIDHLAKEETFNSSQ